MVSIIIVNWNAGAALSACLASLAADAAEGGSARQVILVDNGSSDGSTAVARDRYREVEVLQTGSNLGFAAGANHGAEAARGDVVVFLNPDACVRTGAIRTLVDALLLTPGAGIAGGGLVDAHGRWEPAAARFGPLRHLLLDTTVGRLAVRRTASIGSTARSWRSGETSSATSAASMRATSCTAKISTSATARPARGCGPSTCRRRAPCTPAA